MTWEGRLRVWFDAAKMLKDFGWFGAGLGSFQWIFPGYQSEGLILGWPHAHNDYLELFVELGIPMGILLLVCLGGLILQGFRRLATSPTSRSFFFLFGTMTGVFSLALHGVVDFNFAMPAKAISRVAVTSSVLAFLDAY